VHECVRPIVRKKRVIDRPVPDLRQMRSTNNGALPRKQRAVGNKGEDVQPDLSIRLALPGFEQGPGFVGAVVETDDDTSGQGNERLDHASIRGHQSRTVAHRSEDTDGSLIEHPRLGHAIAMCSDLVLFSSLLSSQQQPARRLQDTRFERFCHFWQ
jgi:hypothetical protein